jgi:hypothetical protein
VRRHAKMSKQPSEQQQKKKHFTMPGPKGSPRTALAAAILVANPDLTIEEAMMHAKYNKKASQCKRRQKNVSKKKNRILQTSGKENVPVFVALNGADGTTGTTSTITRDEVRSDSQTSSNKSQKKQSLEQVAPIRSKSLAASSRRTPKQVLKAQEERNRIEEVRKIAYEWARHKINDEENTESAEQVAREASARFNVQVL